MLFAVDAAVVPHTQMELQSLVDYFSQTCNDFRLHWPSLISLKTTDVLEQDTEAPPSIAIDDYELDVICQFAYLDSTISDNLSSDALIDNMIWKLQLSLVSLLEWVEPTSRNLSVKTNITVYNAFATSLLYGS